MVTTPEAIQSAAEPSAVETAMRVAIAGHKYGAVRRIALYAALTVCLALTYSPAGAVGLLLLILLAMSDQLA